MRSPTRRAAVGLATAALLVSATVSGTSATATSHHQQGHGFGSDTPTVVVDGLDNPRQLAVGPQGALYVAETGHGGSTCQGTGEDEECFGNTSLIERIGKPWSATPSRSTVIDGLLSFAGPDGSFANGLASVGVGGTGRVYSIGASAPENGPPPESAGLLFKVKHGAAVTIADVSAYENDNDPDGQGPESNPYSVLPVGKNILVADAAGNSVLKVDRHGDISTFHVFPNITTGECAGRENDAGTTGCDFVPTALAAGPNGSVYVTGLASEEVGEGRVVKLDKWGHVLKTWSGFTTPVGLAVRGDGTFYVSELLVNFDPEDPNLDPSTVGQVTKVAWSGRVSRAVPLPAGLAIVGDRLYVSAWSTAPATGAFGNPDWNGQIWRLKL